ncbi:unnamed protein product [Gongylonema pulchrum]|uniref:Uncharacterized protein n=1 Tax=Gongylonema pulchrum TaxID=637853 RepID=A0A183DLD0_9BILA|nr:unnamed protein product [Gongylonema pulchrum]
MSSINALHLKDPGTTVRTIPSTHTWYCETGVSESSGTDQLITQLRLIFFSTVSSRGKGTAMQNRSERR